MSTEFVRLIFPNKSMDDIINILYVLFVGARQRREYMSEYGE